MFAVEPYYAEFQEYASDGAGGLKAVWRPCKVIGVTRDESGEPAYIVEVGDKGSTHLQIEGFVRPRP